MAMSEDQHRHMVATQAAHGFMLDFLLKQSLLELPKALRLELVDALLKSSVRTDQFAGKAKGDDTLAERLSDIVIQTQEQIDQMFGRALLACEAAESLPSRQAPIAE